MKKKLKKHLKEDKKTIGKMMKGEEKLVKDDMRMAKSIKGKC